MIKVGFYYEVKYGFGRDLGSNRLMLSEAQGMYLADEAFIFQYSRWRWLSRWLWLNSRWIPVVLIALFGSVEEIEVEKDSGVSCFRDDSGGRWRIPVYRRMRTGLDPRGGESDGGMGDTWLLRCWS